MQIIELLKMCYEFFKTGLFAVGGGLATLPFLSRMSDSYPHWFTQAQLADMVAVSESTPGAIGVNMATYVGYTVFGIPGAVLATLSLVLPSIIVITLIAKALDRYNNSILVQTTFTALRPAVTGLIAAAGYAVFSMAVSLDFGAISSISLPSLILFAALAVLTNIKKLSKIHPVAFIALGAAAGLILKL